MIRFYLPLASLAVALTWTGLASAGGPPVKGKQPLAKPSVQPQVKTSVTSAALKTNSQFKNVSPLVKTTPNTPAGITPTSGLKKSPVFNSPDLSGLKKPLPVQNKDVSSSVKFPKNFKDLNKNKVVKPIDPGIGNGKPGAGQGKDKTPPIDPGIGNGKPGKTPPIDPGIGNGKLPGNKNKDKVIDFLKDFKDLNKGNLGKTVDLGKNKNKGKDDGKKGGKDDGKKGGKDDGKKNDPAHNQTGGAVAVGGNGGDGSNGGNGGDGGDAIAINGDNNTVINGDVTIVNQGDKIVNVNVGGGGGGFFGGPQVVSQVPVAVPVAVPVSGGFEVPAPAPAIVDVTPAAAPAAPNAEQNLPQVQRFLKLKNETSLKLTVYVQYRTLQNGKWVWLPAQPTESEQAVQMVLEPGKTVDVVDAKGQKIVASRIRLWAESERGAWTEFKTKDMWLVTEVDDNGNHIYLAPEMGTFTFVFPGQPAPQAPEQTTVADRE